MVPASSAGNESPPRVVLFSRSISQPAIIEPVHRALAQARELDYQLVSNGQELRAALEGGERVVLFANCLMKEDIADLYNVLPGFEPRVSEGTLRIFVLNSIRHPGLGSLLRSRAVLEIIELPLSMKAVQYKLKQALSFVHHAYLRKKAAISEGVTEGVRAGDAKGRAASAKKKPANTEVHWQSAIDFNADFWWSPSRKNVRNVVGVWLIDLVGPGPVIGTWEEMPKGDRFGEKGWTWRPRPTADEFFQTPTGRWIFFGKQPEFSWQKNMWSFVSKHPMLAFYPENATTPEYVRIEFRPDEGLLFLENSGHTQALLGRIQSTLESRLGFGAGLDSDETEEVTGGFDGWDFPVDDSGGVQSHAPEDAQEGGPEWKDHTGARGFEFEPGSSRSGGAPLSKPFRSALSADPIVGPRVGLGPIETAGLGAGTGTFEKISLHAEALRMNGELLDPREAFLVYEVTESGAVLLVPEGHARLGHRFELRFELESAGLKVGCVMDWEIASVDLNLEPSRLVTGTFRSGDFDTLFRLLDRMDARRKELRVFYEKARG